MVRTRIDLCIQGLKLIPVEAEVFEAIACLAAYNCLELGAIDGSTRLLWLV